MRSGCPECGSLGTRATSGRVDQGTRAGSSATPGSLPQPIAAALQLTWLLTPRELATFELLGTGYDNRSIARALSISERTVKRHITAILAKLRLESRLQVGLVAMITNSVAWR